VACPTDAISIDETYHAKSGFWKTEPRPLPYKMPLKPRDADGNLDEWNAVERAVLNRRSVRNFLDKPVPDHLIRRVLEAGRFAPSAGNCQPWQFIVITDRDLIHRMDEAVWAMINGMYNNYRNDDVIPHMAPMVESSPGLFDPRLALGGMGAIAGKYGPPSLGAPCVILMAADKRAISGQHLNIGICGQNMNLVANSLGIKAAGAGSWSPASRSCGQDQAPAGFRCHHHAGDGMACIQAGGMVAREYRPVTWLREGSGGGDRGVGPRSSLAATGEMAPASEYAFRAVRAR
jgi:nitroreductase